MNDVGLIRLLGRKANSLLCFGIVVFGRHDNAFSFRDSVECVDGFVNKF